MDGIADWVIGFLQEYGSFAPLIMLIFAAAETTAFLSILIPSTAVLAAVGALTATGAIPFWPLWIGASAGALIGSTFSWWLGHRYGGHVLGLYPLRDHPELVERTRNSFAKYGPATVFIGHFVGPLRPVVFLFAGMSGMRFARFQLYNVAGALTWAWAIPKLGQVGGDLLGWLWQFLPF